MQRYNKKHVIQHIFDKLFHYSIAGTYIYNSSNLYIQIISAVVPVNFRRDSLEWPRSFLIAFRRKYYFHPFR